jgi:hypothetical protein
MQIGGPPPASPDNAAIRDTRDSSIRTEELLQKLSASTEELSNSSKRLEQLTFALIFLTVFFATIPIIELVKDIIPKYVVVIIAFGFLGFILYISHPLIKVGNLMIQQNMHKK